MNRVILIGRLCHEPEVRYSQGENSITIARYRLAVDRRYKKKEEERKADFINCVVFGKGAEFAGKYLQKGTKIAVSGRLQTGSYINRDGVKVYTTDVVVEEQEFAESKKSGDNYGGYGSYGASGASGASDYQSSTNTEYGMGNEFADITDEDDGELPFEL